MTCDHFRCWRAVSVFIPGLGAKCSSHAADWSYWPAVRLAEIEDEIKDSRRASLRGAA